jgi:hypothetical protein
MRPLLLSLSLSALALMPACAGGVGGSFRGNGTTARPVAPAKVKVVASKADMTGAYTELGIAKGHAPTAQQAVDQAKNHCGRAGGTFLIMNTEPFQSGSSFQVDATCATDQPVGNAGNRTSGSGKPAR